jgi:hypothetical protein
VLCQRETRTPAAAIHDAPRAPRREAERMDAAITSSRRRSVTVAFAEGAAFQVAFTILSFAGLAAWARACAAFRRSHTR